jgi:spoIIIJ-associated protein
MSPSESIETTAATIDQAISQALAQLGAEQDDVTIEVLSTPRSGVLGLGVRQARVRVTKRAREGAHSGVMSPPPAPPLRPTPPEMRRPEARRSEAATAEVRREPPRPERSEVARGEPGEGRRDERSESRPDLRTDAPREQREPRREMPPRREPRRQDDEREQAGSGQRDDRRHGGRNAPRTSVGRGDASAQSADAASAADRGQPDRRRSDQVQDDQIHSDQVRSDQVEDRRDDGRGAESQGQEPNRESGSRGRRGRGRRGRRQPDNAPPRTAPAQEHDQEQEAVHDDDRDPFAAMDEAGDDPRKSADLQEQAREATIFLRRLLELMGEKATIEPAESDDPETLELNIKGDGSGLLIGRHGQTLDAIEYMVNRLLARQVKDAAPISIDTESYRARRRRLLQRMALSKGEQAKREHVPVMIEPMPPRDRRIVHLALQDDPMITTRSTGDGFMRAIEIVPVDERRSPNERGSENRGRGRGRERDRDQDTAPALGEQGGFKHGQKRIV